MGCLANEAFAGSKMFDAKKGEKGNPFMVEDEYLNFVLENADIEYDHIKTYYQRKLPLLREVILKFYNQRKEVKAKMKGMDESSSKYKDLDELQTGLKLNMNSLYGKLCEKGHHKSYVYIEGKINEYNTPNPKYPCILTGSFITYRARLNLLQQIKAVLDAGYDFLYADTDSVIYGCPITDAAEKIFGKDNGNLGE